MEIDRRHFAVVLGLACLLAFTGGMKYAEYRQSREQAEKLSIEGMLTEDTPTVEEEIPIQIYIAGAVENPGVFKLESGARVYEAVDLARPRPDADLRYINMARKLEDGEAILVNAEGEEDPSLVGLSDFSLMNSSGSMVPGKVDINKATTSELDEKLPGIGPALAQRIVSYRESNGPFAKIEDIANVSGIGEKRFTQIKDLIVVR